MDGYFIYKEKIQEEVNKLKEQDVEIYFIGVGNEVDNEELIEMVSNKNIFRVDIFIVFQYFRLLLLRQVCEGIEIREYYYFKIILFGICYF